MAHSASPDPRKTEKISPADLILPTRVWRNVKVLRLPRDEKSQGRLLPPFRQQRRRRRRLGRQVPRHCRAAQAVHAQPRVQRLGAPKRATLRQARSCSFALHHVVTAQASQCNVPSVGATFSPPCNSHLTPLFLSAESALLSARKAPFRITSAQSSGSR